MRNFPFGKLAVVVVFVAMVLGAARVLSWKRYTDTRSYYGANAGAYLFGPSGALDAKGNAVSRQQLLDAFLHQQIDAHPEWGLHFATK